MAGAQAMAASAATPARSIGALADAPIVVLGVSRSGTTLLRVLLDRHGDISIPSESYFIPQLWDRHGPWPDTTALVRDLGRLARVREWGVDAQTLRQQLPVGASFADVMRAVYADYAQRRGARRFGDKTPTYMDELGLLRHVFPDAVYVHIVRDGRDAAVSFLRMRRRARFSWARPRSVAAFACQWRRQIEAARRLGTEVGRERYHELRYEDLIHRPDEVLAQVCTFLGVSHDPAMLSGEPSEEAADADHELLAGPVRPGRTDWRQMLPAHDVERFEAIAGELLGELGYARAGAPRRMRVGPPVTVAAFEARRRSWRLALRLVRRSPLWALRQRQIRREQRWAWAAPAGAPSPR
jgi:LPS sulfotransferase NodH